MWDLIKTGRNFMKEMQENHVSAYAAQIAYFIILSFIPIIMMLLALIQYTPVTKADLLQYTVKLMPASIDPLMLNLIDEVYKKSTALLSITIIMAVWASGKGILALTKGLNSVYGVKETRNYILVRIRATFYTIIMIVILVLALLLLVFGTKIHLFIEKNFSFVASITKLILSFRTLIMLVVFILFFTMMYRFLPNRKMKLKNQIPGAIFTAIAWNLFSFCFSIYVHYSGGFTYMYGSLTTLIIVMLWLYACMYILLIGAEINAYFEKGIELLLTKYT